MTPEPPVEGRIGFIGLGKMGDPMARRLAAAGFRLLVADADRSRAAQFVSGGTNAAEAAVAEIGRKCGVVITMLPDGAAVREVVLGKASAPGDGLAAGLPPGSVLVDMSSSSPVGTRELGKILSERGVAMLDAPVSGGVRKAQEGTLAIMVGGDRATVERCTEILAAMGRKIFPTGPLGTGHAMKALNNYVSAAGLIAASEAVMAGERFGLDPAVIVDTLNASSGKNNSTENKFRQFILSRAFSSGFSLGLMAKDLRIAMEVAGAAGTPAPLGHRCREVLDEAERALGGNSDHTEVIRYLEGISSSFGR